MKKKAHGKVNQRKEKKKHIPSAAQSRQSAAKPGENEVIRISCPMVGVGSPPADARELREGRLAVEAVWEV